MGAHEEAASSHFKLIASQLEHLTMFVEALADPDRTDGRPETTDAEEAGRRALDANDLDECMKQRSRATMACLEAGGTIETCYVAGSLAEADCFRDKMEEPERKNE